MRRRCAPRAELLLRAIVDEVDHYRNLGFQSLPLRNNALARAREWLADRTDETKSS